MGAMVQQSRNVVVGRRMEQVGRASDLQEAPILQHRDPVAELERLIDVMRDHDHGLLEAVFESEKLVLEIAPSDCVKRAEWFIEQDDGRVGREGSGKGHPLSLPAGQFDGVTCSVPGGIEMNQLQQRMHAGRSAFRIPSE